MATIMKIFMNFQYFAFVAQSNNLIDSTKTPCLDKRRVPFCLTEDT